MDHNYLREDSDFHKWHKYAPLDTQYIKYAESNPSVIAVGHKIEVSFIMKAWERTSQKFRFH